MIESNLHYTTKAISDFFANHRIRWADFYESERRIIAGIQLSPDSSVLDIGCGCGGLGLALHDQFGIARYTGVEINAQAAVTGRTMNPKARIFCGDILELTQNELLNQQFDVVFSLSCVDWNVRFADMLAVAWQHVRRGGYLISTFRLTTGSGCNDIARSYQYINFDGRLEGERAPYVVLNAKSLMDVLAALDPSLIHAYGYWGAPSGTAVTQYEKLCFSAFAIKKRKFDEAGTLSCRLDLPVEIRNVIGQLTR